MSRFHDDPPWATCGIGSLGHEDPDAAVACVLDAALDVPFWPQLPRRGAAECMVPQAAQALGFLTAVDARAARWHVASPRAAPASPQSAAFAPFAAAAAARRLRRIKGQWAGPATLCVATLLHSGETLGENALLRRQALAALQSAVGEQARRLLATGALVDLWLDEPLLGTAAFAPELAEWRGELARRCGPRVRLGVHCCAPPQPVLFELGFDVVSFDARDPDHAPAWLVAALAAQLERGVVAWGVLASEPGREVSSTAAVTALEVWCARLGHQRDAIAQSSLLTPVCGLAALDPAECTARLRALAALQQCLR